MRSYTVSLPTKVAMAAAMTVWCASPLLSQRGLPERQRAKKSLSVRLAAVLGRAEKLGVHCGARVVDLKSKAELYSYHDRRPLRPASNMKILTAIHALETLGPEYRFQTRFQLVGKPAVLVVVSGGDPSFTSEIEGGLSVFTNLAESLRKAGRTSFPGGYVLEAPAWTGPARPPSWPKRHFWRRYGAATGAFALEEGCLALRLNPEGRLRGACGVEFLPSCLDLAVKGSIQLTGDPKNGALYHIGWGAGGTVKLSGHYYSGGRARIVRIPAPDPDALFAEALRCSLDSRGIELGPRRGAAPEGERDLLYLHRTPLKPVIERMLVDSSNFQAEMLLRQCAAKLGLAASFETGVQQLRRRFAVEGVAAQELEIHDGSGLADKNRLSAAVIASVLCYAARAKFGRLFVGSLPQSSISGTLKRRLGGDLRGAVRAKTGYIAGTSALSGYVRTRSGKTCVFAILMNWSKKGVSNRELKRVQDSFVSEIFEHF
ncbi:MAG: D-alanyl-D-alanine carboxypeptidase/D-alanyl-D-alanine-endopeptidase [Planctomycetota bacterium]|nr:MAG: D-alanyl-D-alanine carboxypeptidase/D-alanyl-D-alanine-endopeptidase [Planctomycetota bacterium]